MTPPKSSILVIAGLVGSAALVALAVDGPTWWEDQEIIDTEATANNFGVANIGQAKWMAAGAHAAMEEQLPGGAGFELANLFDPESTVGNDVVANLGQVKALAKPFYDKLISLGYDTRAGIEQSLFYDEYWTHAYPWDPSTPVSENYRPANIGQLKVVFGFDLEAALESSFKPVVWKNPVRAVPSYPPGEGSTLSLDSGSVAWVMDATGSGLMYGDGALRFQASQTNKYFKIGLSYAASTHVIFYFYTKGDSEHGQLDAYEQLDLYENAVNKFNSTYNTDTLIELRREGSSIKYFRDGVLMYTHEGSVTAPLKVSSAFYQPSATARNCLVRGFSNADDDSDGDGMTDEWEYNNGLNHFSAADAKGDQDSDGITNLEEFLAGTDAETNDSGSFPGMSVGFAVLTPLE